MHLPRGVRELILDPTDEASAPSVVISDPAGTRVLPSFLGADGQLRVRVRAQLAGDYSATVTGRDEPFASWSVDEPVTFDAPLLHRAGRVLADDQNRQFFWLADTWWFALCDRVSEAELAGLARLRVEQGYSVVQVVAGLFPEVDAFESLGDLAGRWPWTADFGALDPLWWDAADRRLTMIIEAGLTPAVVGAWSYYLLDMGPELMTEHWRQVVARWAAFPLVWCVAGEAGLPHYPQLDDPDLAEVVAGLSAGWQSVTAEVRELDPYANVRTVHPCPAFGHFSSTDAIGRADDLDLIWLQTGHADRSSVPDSLAALRRELAADHGLPVINSEVCYEGIAAGSSSTLQRFLFFSHVLSGAAGHTYGAQGLWAFRRAEDPGPGILWGDATWSEAAVLPGSAQLGRAAGLLRELDWSGARPAPEALSIHADDDRQLLPYAAWIGDHLVAYFPAVSLLPAGHGISDELRDVGFRGLKPGSWQVRYWNPRRADRSTEFAIMVGDDGALSLRDGTRRSALPSMEDWLVVVSPG